ncbi:hypothetical protein SVIOM342S_02577 [Streptomyces violaceorubidus]
MFPPDAGQRPRVPPRPCRSARARVGRPMAVAPSSYSSDPRGALAVVLDEQTEPVVEMSQGARSRPRFSPYLRVLVSASCTMQLHAAGQLPRGGALDLMGVRRCSTRSSICTSGCGRAPGLLVLAGARRRRRVSASACRPVGGDGLQGLLRLVGRRVQDVGGAVGLHHYAVTLCATPSCSSRSGRRAEACASRTCAAGSRAPSRGSRGPARRVRARVAEPQARAMGTGWKTVTAMVVPHAQLAVAQLGQQQAGGRRGPGGRAGAGRRS